MDTVARNLAAAYPEADKNVGITLVSLKQDIVGNVRPVLLTLLAAVAFLLLIACTNVANLLLARSVSRLREFAIRAALGAQRRDILRLVLGQGARMALAGVSVGVLAALALTRLMASQLFGVGAHDPATFACVSILLMAVAVAACYVPSRRAMRVDPIAALRHE